MNKFIKLGVASIGIAVLASGCGTTGGGGSSSEGSNIPPEKGFTAKWEEFKSIPPYAYENLGFAQIDGIGQEVSVQTGLYIEDVVKPMIEADKEGYTGAVAQFNEDVAEAKKNGKTENDVLEDWAKNYGAESVAKLKEGFAFVRQQQDGKNAMLAVAVDRLPKYVELSKNMPKAIDEIKAGCKNPFKLAKLVGSASQVGERVNALVKGVDLMKTLSGDKAAETKALQAAVDAFQSKVN